MNLLKQFLQCSIVEEGIPLCRVVAPPSCELAQEPQCTDNAEFADKGGMSVTVDLVEWTKLYGHGFRGLME